MRKFRFQLSDPELCKFIDVDVNKCVTIEDFKSKIAEELHLDSAHLSIENQKESMQLRFVKENTFQLKINNCCTIIQFYLPNKQQVTIHDGYKKKYIDVISEFETKNFYCSQSCARNNLEMKILDRLIKGKDLQKEPFPFLGIPAETKCIPVCLTGGYIVIEFDKKIFYFSESDLVQTASDLICRAFRTKTFYETFSIRKDQTKEELSPSEKLNKDEKYDIHCQILFNFINITFEKGNFKRRLDSYTTVSVALNILQEKYKKNSLKLENIHIVSDKNDKIAADENKPLMSYQDEAGFVYYYIDDLKKTLNKGKKESKPIITQQETEEKKVQENPKSDNDKNSKSNYDDSKKSKTTKEEESKTDNTKSNKTNEDVKSKSNEGDKKSKSNFDDDRKPKTDNGKKVEKTKYTEEEKPKSKYDDKKTKSTEKKDSKISNMKTNKDDKNTKPKNKNDHDKNEKPTNSNPSKSTKHPISLKKLIPKVTPVKNESSDGSTKEEKNSEKTDTKTVHTYYYKVNTTDEIQKIKLKEGETIYQFKEKVAQKNKNVSPSNIKVIFAGKDLLDDIVVDELEIGNDNLFVYIKSLDDILLLTAKALRINKKDDEEDDNDNI